MAQFSQKRSRGQLPSPEARVCRMAYDSICLTWPAGANRSLYQLAFVSSFMHLRHEAHFLDVIDMITLHGRHSNINTLVEPRTRTSRSSSHPTPTSSIIMKIFSLLNFVLLSGVYLSANAHEDHEEHVQMPMDYVKYPYQAHASYSVRDTGTAASEL